MSIPNQSRHIDCRTACQYDKEVGHKSAVCTKRCYRASQAHPAGITLVPAPEVTKTAPTVADVKTVLAKVKPKVAKPTIRKASK